MSRWRGGRAPGGRAPGPSPRTRPPPGPPPSRGRGEAGKGTQGRIPRGRVSASPSALTLAGLPSRSRVSARGRASSPCLPCDPGTVRPLPPLGDGVSHCCTWVDGGRAEGLCSLRLGITEETAARSSCLHCAFVHTRGVGLRDPGETGSGRSQVA